MSLATLRTAVWDLLLQEDASPTAADDVTLLAAFNHIRQDAERKHDWVATEAVGYLRVTATTGSPLSDTKVGYSSGAPSGSALLVKQPRYARIRDTANTRWVRATLMKPDVYEALRNKQINTVECVGELRDGSYDESDEPDLYDTRNLLLLDGLSMYTQSTSNVDVKLWCYQWLAAYANTSAPDDFLISYGSDYMLWATVCFLNKKKGTFLPRNEGSLTEDSPIAMRDAAWESLLLWDSGLKNYTTFIGA